MITDGRGCRISAAAFFAEWRRSSLFFSAFTDCPGGLRAVVINEISLDRLKARKAGGQSSKLKRRFKTAGRLGGQ